MAVSSARTNLIATTCLCFALTSVAPERAEASGKGIAIGVGAAVVGLMIGHAIANAQKPQRIRTPVRPVDKSEGIRLVQRALLALGFYQGDINGKMDKPTQQAVIAFQTRLGEKPTGSLTSGQRQVLLANYAQTTRPAAATAAAQPGGLMALIAAGGGAVAAQTTAPGAAAATTAPTPTEAPRAPFFATVCRDDATPASAPSVQAIGSLRLTPDQFCVARSAALAEASDVLVASGQSDIAAVRSGCESFADGMRTRVAAVTTDPAATLQQALRKDFAKTPADTSAPNFKICLGIGYAEDRPDLILASSFGLIGIGEIGYGELVGGVLGVGMAPYDQKTRAAEWLDLAAAQIEKGARSVVGEFGQDRAGILRLEAKELRGEPARAPIVTASAEPRTVIVPAVVGKAPTTIERTTIETAPAPAPVVAAAPAAPVDPRTAMVQQAKAFFAKESADQTVKLDALSSVLGLDKADIVGRCRPLLASTPAPDAAKGLDPAMLLRLCRAWSYSAVEGAAMYAFDRRLADGGDADAASRLPFHMIVGNDRAPLAAQ